MTEKAKEARRAYKREWARNNPEKIRAYQNNYWDKKAMALEDQQARQPQEVQQAQAAGA